MFQNLNPIRGGVGMRLLQKMGWKPGQVIGKRGEGSYEPIALDVKTDRKGLVSSTEAGPPGKGTGKGGGKNVRAAQAVQGKVILHVKVIFELSFMRVCMVFSLPIIITDIMLVQMLDNFCHLHLIRLKRTLDINEIECLVKTSIDTNGVHVLAACSPFE